MAFSSVRLHWPEPAAPPTASLTLPLTRTRDGDPQVQLFAGDNLAVAVALREHLRGQVTLAYLDPPFLTMRQHEKVDRRRTAGGPPVRVLTPAFDDRWHGLTEYLSSLRSRLEALRELLAPHGSIVVHVDPRTSHYVKVLGDEIFGPDAFASEIIWRYRRWPARTANFQRMHDVLLRWVKDPDASPRFVQLYEELAPSTLKTWGRGRQRAVFDDDGRRRRSSTETQQSPGTPLGDVWDIPIIAPVAKERTGYPTQKPEALLQRLIEACSQPGDLVLDPCMGSGTTVAVAARLARRVIGIDQSPVAMMVTRERLERAGVSFQEWSVSRDAHADDERPLAASGQ